MANFVEINVAIPRNLYEEIEKRAKIIGTSVQMYVRTLLERHISKVKEKYHDLEIEEVDLIIKLRNIIKKIKMMAKEGDWGKKMSKTCAEDLAHIVRSIIDQVKQRTVRICVNRSASECNDYIKLKELEGRILNEESVVERMRIILSEYEDDAIQHIKKLFYMDRCSLAELAIIFPYAIDKSIVKLLKAILEIDV